MAKEKKERTWKCQWCDISDTHKDDMETVMTESKKPIAKRYHKHCFTEYLKDKEFKEQERIELDKLVEVIKDIYGVKTIPNSAYPYLQELRNGTKFFGKYDYKYKEGYSYELIAETFSFCSETIEYWNSVKNFNGFNNALRYGLTVVCDKLSIVEQRRKNRIKQREMMNKHIENIDVESHEFETSYKKPSKTKADITDFLDD